MNTNRSMTTLTTAGFSLALFLAAAGMTAAFAQEEKKERGPEDYNVLDADKLPITIPFKEVAHHVVVDMAVGDSEPLAFMFDTGAGSFLTTELAETHASQLIGEIKTASGGNKITTQSLRLYPSVTVAGSVEIREVLALDPWAVQNTPLYCVTPYGLLGASAMMNGVWQVDYGSNEITVASSVDQLDHIDGAIAVPFTPQPGLSPTPLVELPVGDGKLLFIVDTGGGIGIAVNTADAASVGLEAAQDTPLITSMAAGAAGTFESSTAFVKTAVTFGDRKIDYPIAIGDGMAPTTQGNIGHNFLKNFVVTWDWSSNTMYLDPLAEDDSVPLPNPPGGGSLAWDGEKIIVGAVIPGSSAAEAGLAIGQTVTAVDGQSVEGATIDDFCTLFSAGAHQTLTTENGTTFDISPIEGFYSEM